MTDTTSRELELTKVIVEATTLKAKAQAELNVLKAQGEKALEEARDEIVSEAERLLEMAADFSNTHQLGDFTVEAEGGYGDYYDGGSTLEWNSDNTRNWNASTC